MQVIRSPIRCPIRSATHDALKRDRFGRQFLLDAATGLVLPGFAYTRSGPALWLPQQDGSLASFGPDVLPRSFGPGGWGYEFHPGWTQSALHSIDLSNAAWGKTRCTAANVSFAHPLGGSLISKISEDTSANLSHLAQSSVITSVAGASYTARAIIYPDERKHAALCFTGGGGGTDRGIFVDLLTGAVTGAFGSYPASYGATLRQDGGVDLYITEAAPGAAGYAARVYLCNAQNTSVYTGDGSSGLRVAVLNFTNTSYPVPLTVATTAPGVIGTHTMAATLSSLGVTLGAEYTIGMEYEVLGRIANQYPPVAQLRVGTTGGSNISSGFFVHPNGTQFAIVRDTADVYLQQSGAAGFAKSVLGVKAANFRAASNGVLAAAGSTGTPPSGLTAIQVARDGGGPSGAMRVSRLYLIPARRAPDAELAAMTA